jgi:hypothetical protein
MPGFVPGIFVFGRSIGQPSPCREKSARLPAQGQPPADVNQLIAESRQNNL